MINFKETKGGLVIAVKVQPNSKRDKIIGTQSGALKVAVTPPPQKGKANKRLIEVFSKEFGMKKSDIVIVAGKTQRQKKILLKGKDRKFIDKIK